MCDTRDTASDRAALPRPGHLPAVPGSPEDAPGTVESGELARQFLQQRDVLYGYIFALARDHHAAEEILQELGVSILTEAKRGTVPKDFIGWARGVARHRVADYFRSLATRRQHEKQFEEFADVVDLAFAEQTRTAADNQHELQLLRDCLQRLTQRVRTMIELRYQGRQSLDQIATALQWKTDSVKVAMSRARRVLSECVERKLRSEGAVR